MNVLLVTKMKPVSGNEEGAWPCAWSVWNLSPEAPKVHAAKSRAYPPAGFVLGSCKFHSSATHTHCK